MRQMRLQWDTTLCDTAPWLHGRTVRPEYQSAHGVLYAMDCLEFLAMIRDGVVDTVFADPPFNIGKQYGPQTDDLRAEDVYTQWCERWLDACVRVLKPGGALFLYHLPRWNMLLGASLVHKGLVFRHWIAVDIPAGPPIAGRLHPSHYSLLYMTKGTPRVFHRIRTPIEVCRHCAKELKDYGGHRESMHPHGVTLKDVWSDIPPVRHAKFATPGREANALSTKLLERIIRMSTDPGDLVCDPFGGSGTTYAVCEAHNRYWIGGDIDYAQEISLRLQYDDVAFHANTDRVER